MKTTEKILIDRDDRQISVLISKYQNAIPLVSSISQEYRKLGLGNINSKIFIRLLNDGIDYVQKLYEEKIDEYFADDLIRRTFLTNAVPDYSSLKKAVDDFVRVMFGVTTNMHPEFFQFDENGNALFTVEKQNEIIEEYSQYISSESEIMVYEKAKKIMEAINDFNSLLPKNIQYSPWEIGDLFMKKDGNYVPGVGILYPAKFYHKSD